MTKINLCILSLLFIFTFICIFDLFNLNCKANPVFSNFGTVVDNSDIVSMTLDEELKRGNKCPLCDPSVYSYCSEKLLHDACCCLNPYENKLPQQCKYADCSFLHANSCQEHRLITSCCCSTMAYSNEQN